MDSTFVCIELDKKDDIIHFEPLSDEHFGDPKQDIKLLERRQNAILDDPNRYTAFGGDMLNNIMPFDKRWSLESTDSNSTAKELQDWEEFHKPLFDLNKKYLKSKKIGWPKVWYGLAGNHEYKDRTIDHYAMKRMFDPHGIEYLGTTGFVGLQINWKGEPLNRYKLAVTHGFGGGASIDRALNDFMQNKTADVFLMGHMHHKSTDEQIMYDYSFKDKSYVERKILLGNTGNFTNAVIRGRTSWLEQRNKQKFSPPGTITISFDAYGKSFGWHG